MPLQHSVSIYAHACRYDTSLTSTDIHGHPQTDRHIPTNGIFNRHGHRTFAAALTGRGDDMVGNPHRAQIYQFELFELILSLNLDKQLPVEQFEAKVSQSTVPSPPLEVGNASRRDSAPTLSGCSHTPQLFLVHRLIYLVQRFHTLDSKDLGLWDLGTSMLVKS